MTTDSTIISPDLHTDFYNNIAVEAEESGTLQLEAFASEYARLLEESEQLFDLDITVLRCHGPRNRRLEILGYAYDSLENSLSILCGKYYKQPENTLTRSEAEDVFSRALSFFELSKSGWLGENLEVSSPEAQHADYFQNLGKQQKISRVRLVLVTDGVMSERIKTFPPTDLEGIKVTYEIWDLARTIEAQNPSKGSEDIHVDFTRWISGGLQCLRAHSGNSDLETYLAVIPGRVLAEVFSEWGSLLLESNVRTFLSARGAVNKGIQVTLDHEPERFLAYNNGLTTTAVGIKTVETADGLAIESLDQWQIVNGGQTTASIAHFLRKHKDKNVDDVFVQMKLVIVDPESSQQIVNSVAKYANSQNRISGADLFASHEFHIRMEQISRRLKAPATEGLMYQTGWYYERARNQWENDKNSLYTAKAQKKFELEFPKQQRLTKTDWAKYAYCWGMRPDVVSKGAQTLFLEYAKSVDEQWEANSDQFNDGYFKNAIAKAILYSSLHTAVRRSDWYKSSPGYLANIVAYAIARFNFQVKEQFQNARFDLMNVWQKQMLSQTTLDLLLSYARAAQVHLTDENRPQANVTQWAKQAECWKRFREIRLPDLPPAISSDLISNEEATSRETMQKKERRIDSELDLISQLMRIPERHWNEIKHSQDMNLSPVETALLSKFALVSFQRGIPSERQAMVLKRIYDRALLNGIVYVRS